MVILLVILVVVILFMPMLGGGSLESLYTGGDNGDDLEQDRSNLPYRPVSECFLLYDGEVLAQDKGHFIMFPGGGNKPDETPKEAAEREIKEETGAILDGPLVYITTMTWDWMPEWANTEKRKRRYQKFRGEEMHYFIGIVKELGEPGSVSDAWTGDMTMDIDELIDKHKRLSERDHENTRCYRSTQQAMLHFLKYLSGAQ